MASNMDMENIDITVGMQDVEIDKNHQDLDQALESQNPLLPGEFTALGTVPVPIVNNRDELLSLIETHQDDTRFLRAILKATTVELSPLESELVKRIEAEYIAWCDPLCTEIILFDDYVTQLKEELSLGEQNAEAVTMEEFCEEQIRIYQGIHHSLTRVHFPYSEKQRELLDSFEAHIEWATGDPTQMADIEAIEVLQHFVGSMEVGHHVNHLGFYINCTIDFYVQEIIEDLSYYEYEEKNRVKPPQIPENALVDIATYIRGALSSSFKRFDYEDDSEVFHLGLAEVHYHFVEIFQNSQLKLSAYQTTQLRCIKQDIGTALQQRSNGAYENLHLAFCAFMDSLRRKHPKREMKVDGPFWKLNDDGKVTKQVTKIGQQIEKLCETADNHFDTFKDYSAHLPNNTNIMFHYFSRIFPPTVYEPIAKRTPIGNLAAAVNREWFRHH